MAKDHPITSNNTPPPPPPPPSSVADSYIGSFISVTSKSEIRYEGVLYFLNPQDSTLGLQNVRSYGTEGRKKDGPQVPPSDKIYEYILFRGSDIKDLEVKTGPPAQIQESIYNDPAIIQSNYHAGPSSSLNSVSAGSGSVAEVNLCSEPSALSARSFPSVLPSHSGSQLGLWGSSQSADSSMPSYSMPTQWQNYSGARSIVDAQQHLSNNASPGHSFSTSNSIYLNATSTLTSGQLPAPLNDSVSSKLSPPFHHSTLINSNGLSLPFPLTYQNTSSTEAVVANKVVFDRVPLLPAQSAPYSASSVSDKISDPLLWQQPPLLTPNHLSRPRLSEHSLEKNFYSNQKDVGVMNSMPFNFSSSLNTPAVQPLLLPLPPPTEKLQNSSQFNEEFDFQAMNEKFKKDEVWGYLGKANQRDKTEGIQEYGTRSQDLVNDNSCLKSKSEAKPSYSKDDFFDTISCNSFGRGARNGQNQFSERAKLDSETFGRFQRRSQQLVHDGYGGGRGEHRGPYNWERGHNYGNRGRGGFRQR
ncbi:hypothetical protein BUALT_Bualt05G0034800 [Buddleja alternifolia]|uniref:Protein decapping 5-like n=1 Tax=Buddleja alternifolia TaxID=168488 RepID=A0AAV6XN85_9LAMI|nr:hypothetical protein BUALT_Bualt05G0034800 [Buddleja alternifolia]